MSKINGSANAVYWFGLVLIALTLFVWPIYGLLLGDTGAITSIMEFVQGDREYTEDRNFAIDIGLSVIGAFVILICVYAPGESFKSPLNFSGMHILDGVNKLNSDLLKGDKSVRDTVLFKIAAYGGVFLIAFASYIYLISQILSSIEGGSIIQLLSLVAMVIVFAAGNSMVLNSLEKKDPAPILKDGTLEYPQSSEAFQDASTRVLWGIILAVVNIILLTFSLSVSTYVESKIEGFDNVNSLLQGEDVDLENLLD